MKDYLKFRDLFAEALDPVFYDIFHLDQRLLEGSAFLFTTDASAVIVEIKDYPTGARVVHGLIAAGDADDIVETLIPQAEAWGKANGCTHAEVSSRPAWQRILKARGYEPHQIAVRREL